MARRRGSTDTIFTPDAMRRGRPKGAHRLARPIDDQRRMLTNLLPIAVAPRSIT
jgi:hypothetical protein